MNLTLAVKDAFLAAWLPHALHSMSKERMLRLIDLIGTFNPTWKQNVAPARELIERDHPLLQWVMALRRDLHPRVFYKFAHNLILQDFVADRQTKNDGVGDSPLASVLFSVTERCNLKCEGCWASEYDKREDLPLSLMDRAIREMREMRCNFVTFTGGEPFLRKDIFDLIASHPKTFFQIFTNGTLITPEVADRLVELGNVIPMVSVNGFEEENDAIRGKGNFQAVSAALDVMRERGLLIGVSLTATSKNMDSMTDVAFYDWLIEKGVKVGWVFQYMPVGRDPDIDLMVTPEQRKALGQFVYKLRNSRPIFIADFWNDGYLVEGCMAGGRAYAHITNRGEVEPCVFCHFAVDNINDKSLKEVLSSPFFTEIRKAIPYDGNLLRPCMMIDRPGAFRSYVAKHHPHPTHRGAESLVSELAPGLDERARRVQAIMDPVWNSKDFAGIWTLDPRWYNTLPQQKPAEAESFIA